MKETTTMNIRNFPVATKNKFDLLMAKKKIADKSTTQGSLASQLMEEGMKKIK